MTKCGMFNCEEDFITYEDLAAPCIGVEDNKCVSCDTVHETISANSENFFENPVRTLFDEDIKEENLKKFWEDLFKYCKVKYIVLAKEKAVFISPDIDSANRNFQNLVKNIERRGKGSYIPYIRAMKNIIDTSPKVTLEIARDISIEVLDKNLKSKYTQFLRDGGLEVFSCTSST